MNRTTVIAVLLGLLVGGVVGFAMSALTGGAPPPADARVRLDDAPEPRTESAARHTADATRRETAADHDPDSGGGYERAPEAAVAEPRSAPDAPATPVAAPARPSNEAESATADASEPRTEPAPGSAPAPAVEPALGPTAGADRRGAEEVAAAPAAGELARGTRWRAVQAVNVRAGPSNDSERVTTVDGGTEVTVLDEELGWKEVVLPDGRRGYIYRKWLSPVDG